ncbi:MAG: alkaline phosphatase family protein [Candidatus Lokiarchaeota archaeon]|nr:alkaline phosphatase family protein [Candidatus Lokiarchaeota archaeon]
MALDGLSWNLIEELIAKKKIKNIEEIVNNGVSAVLRAEGFLSSPKIFCSIFTGKKVEKHGIKDFYSKEEDLSSKQIWDILHKKGFKIGVYRPLSVWSAKKFDGFCIPSPMLLEKNTYPEELYFIGELDKKARSEKYSLTFLIKIFWNLFKFQFSIKALFKIIKRSISLSFKNSLEERMFFLKEIELIIHTNLYYKLLKKYKSHFTVFFDYSFDTLSHIYWKNEEEYSKYPDVLPNAYKIVDRFIGKVKSFAAKNNYHLLICSDHGFEETEKKNRKNFRTINVLYLLRELKFYYDVYGIYMTQTVVFRMRPNSSRPLNDFKRAIESIKCEGKQLFNIRPTSKKLIVRINDFFGDKRNFKVELPNGKKLNLDEITDFNPANTGTHSENYGVFMIQGSRIKKGKKIGDITPYDIAPTILSLFGEPIPSEMDGRVLTEIFNN